MQGKRALVAAPLFHMNALVFSMVAAKCGATDGSDARFSGPPISRRRLASRPGPHLGAHHAGARGARRRDWFQSLDLSHVEFIFTGSAPSTQALFDKVAEIFPNAPRRERLRHDRTGPVVFGAHPEGKRAPEAFDGYPLSSVRVAGSSAGPTPDEGVLWMRTDHDAGLSEPAARRPREAINDGWYDTGDIMRRDADGFFYFVGRADDMFVCGGENIYPGEVEKLLERHPASSRPRSCRSPTRSRGRCRSPSGAQARNAPTDDELKQIRAAPTARPTSIRARRHSWPSCRWPAPTRSTARLLMPRSRARLSPLTPRPSARIARNRGPGRCRAKSFCGHGGIEDITFEPNCPTRSPGRATWSSGSGPAPSTTTTSSPCAGMPGIKLTCRSSWASTSPARSPTLGSEVAGWKVGDRVIVDPIDRKPAGMIGEAIHGGMAELVPVRRAQLCPLPDDVGFERPPPCPSPTAPRYRMMVTRGKIAAGEKVLILGASGGVGTCCVQLAKLAGAEVDRGCVERRKARAPEGAGRRRPHQLRRPATS